MEELIEKETEIIKLTAKEIETLSLAMLGFTNKEIASFNFVTEDTVKQCFKSIFKKLNAKSRTQAATIALINHIITKESLEEVEKKYKSLQTTT